MTTFPKNMSMVLCGDTFKHIYIKIQIKNTEIPFYKFNLEIIAPNNLYIHLFSGY